MAWSFKHPFKWNLTLINILFISTSSKLTWRSQTQERCKEDRQRRGLSATFWDLKKITANVNSFSDQKKGCSKIERSNGSDVLEVTLGAFCDCSDPQKPITHGIRLARNDAWCVNGCCECAAGHRQCIYWHNRGAKVTDDATNFAPISWPDEVAFFKSAIQNKDMNFCTIFHQAWIPSDRRIWFQVSFCPVRLVTPFTFSEIQLLSLTVVHVFSSTSTSWFSGLLFAWWGEIRNLK